jgi:hypothetical protein
MKRILLLTCAILLAACGGGKEKGTKKLASGGAPYEVVVIATDADWNSGGLGDSIHSVLEAAVPHINSYEPQFDVLHMLPERFTGATRRNGNVMIVQLSDKYTRPQLAPRPDEFASPQMVVYAVAPDAATLAQYMSTQGEELRRLFNNLERDRWVAAARRSPAVDIQSRINEKFGLGGIALLHGFVVGKETEDFMWVRFRYPEADQELSIYSYPARGPLTVEGLVTARDRFVKLIPGEVPDSHMITATEFVEPVLQTVTINGREWVEMRGLWEVKNDFMGGSFVSYSTVLDGRVLTVDGAVYSPSPYKMKRNLLRQLESVVHSIKL